MPIGDVSIMVVGGVMLYGIMAAVWSRCHGGEYDYGITLPKDGIPDPVFLGATSSGRLADDIEDIVCAVVGIDGD